MLNVPAKDPTLRRPIPSDSRISVLLSLVPRRVPARAFNGVEARRLRGSAVSRRRAAARARAHDVVGDDAPRRPRGAARRPERVRPHLPLRQRRVELRGERGGKVRAACVETCERILAREITPRDLRGDLGTE